MAKCNFIPSTYTFPSNRHENLHWDINGLNLTNFFMLFSIKFYFLLWLTRSRNSWVIRGLVERFHSRRISSVPKKENISQRTGISLFANTCIDELSRENAL